MQNRADRNRFVALCSRAIGAVTKQFNGALVLLVFDCDDQFVVEVHVMHVTVDEEAGEGDGQGDDCDGYKFEVLEFDGWGSGVSWIPFESLSY